MSTCCICGKEITENIQAILVNGKECPVCDECAVLLDTVESEERQKDEIEQAAGALKQKMLDNASSMDVYTVVTGIISGSRDSDAAVSREEKEQERVYGEEQQAESAPRGTVIQSLVNFLTVFAVIFLIGGILLSLIVGGILTGAYETRILGWFLIIGGTMISILVFAEIMLGLGVAEAVGRMDERMKSMEALLGSIAAKNRKPASKPAAKKNSK